MIPIVTPVIVYKRDCPRCGQKVDGGYLTCPQCGNELPRLRSNVFVILGLLLLLIAGLVVFSRYI